MDADGTEDTVSEIPRRSTRRLTTGKTLIFEVTPRGPIKRSKGEINKMGSSSSSVPIVNGSKNLESGSEDEESPNKKSRLDEEEIFGDKSGDKKEMAGQESAQDQYEDQEMDSEEDSIQIHSKQTKIISQSPFQTKGVLGVAKLSPYVVLGERCRLGENTDRHVNEPKVVVSSTKETTEFTKPSAPTRSFNNVQSHKITSMAEYKQEMEAKAKSSGISRVNRHNDPSVQAPTVTSHTVRQRANYFPTGKESISHKKKEQKQKQVVTSRTSVGSSRGFLHYFCWLLLVFLLLSSAVLLLGKNKLISLYQRSSKVAVAPTRSVKLEPFAALLSEMETRFRNQRPELWKRSRIHLEKHLKTPQPTEPVSLILTSGRGAEKTLACLAERLAAAFSSALESSVLHVDGAAKAGQESDEVKLDIDGQLRAAFGGNRTAAVIHRLEELPPGSTLIFYRYCDHEHSAFKEVFLLFTVLLPRDEVSGQLGAVEEMVQDYLKDRLVGPSSKMAFNEMDTDKFGGLWSRISHLVLPVVAEEDVEQNGC
nr:torsin-1A-interacting protein 2-like [Nerophis lumbriciformis]